MEPRTAGRLRGRKRRAVGLIALSLLALAAASLTWIVPGLHPGGATDSKNTAANPVLTTPSQAAAIPTMYEFATPSVGWAVSARPIETKVFQTIDGGKHWRLASRLEGTIWATIQFVDITHGFLFMPEPQRIYRTTDGGSHWAPVAMPIERVYGMTFTDRRRGSLLVQALSPSPSPRPRVYATDDGGYTWRRLPDLPQNSYDPVFRNDEVWLGEYGSLTGGLHVYRSDDGGQAWSSVEVPPPRASQSSADLQLFGAQVMLLPGAGVAVLVSVGPNCGKPVPCASSEEGQVVSFDRGGTWSAIPLPPSAFTYRDIAYQDDSHWWAIGAGSLFKSSDAGQTWQRVSSTAPQQGRFVLHVIDAQHAWAQTFRFATPATNFQMAAVAVTSDGGVTWQLVLPPKI